MVQIDPTLLPTSDELLDSDDLPVDNELHTLVPNLLRFILNFIWSSRLDWFFGVNMGVYHTTSINLKVPVVPDGFLSLGIDRLLPKREGKLRLSYVVWEEKNIVPIFALEVVSRTPGDEYDEKMEIYAKLGVLYYLIYNPDHWLRDQHEPFEMYRLVDGIYQRRIGEPFWMSEVGLGIGRAWGIHDRVEREWLYWYDEQGNRYLSPEELTQQAQQQALEAQQQALEAQQQALEAQQQALEAQNRSQQLEEILRSLGVDPDIL